MFFKFCNADRMPKARCGKILESVWEMVIVHLDPMLYPKLEKVNRFLYATVGKCWNKLTSDQMDTAYEALLRFNFGFRKLIAEDCKAIYTRLLLEAMVIPNVREVRWRFCEKGNHVYFKFTNNRQG